MSTEETRTIWYWSTTKNHPVSFKGTPEPGRERTGWCLDGCFMSTEGLNVFRTTEACVASAVEQAAERANRFFSIP